MEVVVEGFGTRLRARRKELKLTQIELANKVGTGSDVVSKHERGELGVSTKTLFAYAEALETTAEYLAGTSGDSRRPGKSSVVRAARPLGVPAALARLLNDGRCNPLNEDEMAHMTRYLDDANSTELDDLEIHLLAYRAERDRTKKAIEAFQRAIDRANKGTPHQLVKRRNPVTQ